jgi:hypothetical protein
VALRLYLTNDVAPYVPPTIRGTWTDKVLNGVNYLSRRKTGVSVTAAKAETSNSASWAVLCRRFVSETVNNPGTLQGTFQLVAGWLESNAAANMVTRVHMYVTVGSTDVVRGTLTALALDGTAEFDVVGFGTGADGIKMTGTCSSVAVQVGDRVVLEIGFKAANTVTTSYTGTFYYGGTGADLVPNDRNVTTRVGWIEFAHTSFHDAFDIPFRTGATTTTVGVTQQAWDPSKVKTATTTTTLGVANSTPAGYKSVKTITGNVRPPGRPPGHPPAAETGSITTGSSERDGGTVTQLPKPNGQGSAVRVASTTAESTTDRTTLKGVPYALIQGEYHDVSPPNADLLTQSRPPNPQKPVRFICQDIRTHRFLTYELPLVDVSITWQLSGPSMLTAKLHPESPTLQELGITAWATWIHVDQDGQLLGSFILQPARIDGEDYSVEGMGFSGYAQGIPYYGWDDFVATDACDVMRRIWNHLESFPDARLGVQLTNTMSNLLLGIPATQELTDEGFLVWDEQNQIEEKAPTKTLPEGTDIEITGHSFDSGPKAPFAPDFPDLMVTYNDGAIYRFHPKMVEAQPYTIAWFNDTDCGQEFDNLAKTAKVEYREVTFWDLDPTHDISVIPKPRRSLEMVYPRLGRKRYELRVAQDENLLAAIPLEESTGESGYASQILARGVGEGREAQRAYYGNADPKRIRRVAIVKDGTLFTQAQMTALAVDELHRRLAAITIGTIVLKDWHPNAPLGSFMVGDEFLVTGFVPWAGYVEFWHRVISYTWEPAKNTITCTTRRSEQFAYGAPIPDPQPIPKVLALTWADIDDDQARINDPAKIPDPWQPSVPPHESTG